ncbi:hypothetical protein Pcinc_032682, partial [Petrolisthes cinctipes]
DALVSEIQQTKWRRRIIPAILPQCPNNHNNNNNTQQQHNHILPFGLRGIQGITLGDDPRTVELISGIINVESQMQVRAAQRRSEAMLHLRLRRLRQEKVTEVKEVVQGLRRQFGDHHDPTLQLQQMTEQLQRVQEPSTSSSSSCDQLINVSGCSNVTMGPSFHFLVASSNSSSTSQPEIHQSTSSSLHQSPSTSHQSPSTSHQTGSTSLQSANASFTTLYSQQSNC